MANYNEKQQNYKTIEHNTHEYTEKDEKDVKIVKKEEKITIIPIATKDLTPDIEFQNMENKGDPYFYHTRKRVTTKFRNSMDNLDLMNDLKARDNLDMQSILTPYENNE